MLLVPHIWKRALEELPKKTNEENIRLGVNERPTHTKFSLAHLTFDWKKERTATIVSLVGINVVKRINKVTCSHCRSMAICKPTVEDVYFCGIRIK